MAATSGLIRARFRRRALALVPLVVVVAAGASGALVALGAAERTSTAYDRYLERAEVGDLQINPSLPTMEIDRLIRSLPGVEKVTTHDLLAVVGGPEATGGSVVEANSGQVRGSVDGRFVEMDRPALKEGRLPTGRHEVLLDTGIAEFYDLHVGSVVPLTLAPSASQFPDYEPAPGVDPPGPSSVRVRVVGIGTFPDEVLPDGLYPRQRAVVSADVSKRYACTPRPLPADGTMSEVIDAVFPDGCAINYRYYSLSIRGGDRGVQVAQDAYVREGTKLNETLPEVLRAQDLGYELIPRVTARDRDRIERAIRPTVTALTVLGLAVGLVTLVAVAIVVGREVRRSTPDQLQWWQLGLATTQRATVVAVPLLVALGLGIASSVAIAYALSTIGPVGNVRDLEPSPSHVVSGWVAVAAALLGVASLITAVVLAWTASRRIGRPSAPSRRPSVIGRLADRSPRPGVAQGVRAAFARDRGGGFVVAAGALAIGVLVTAVVFGASLTRLVDTPKAYGWPWDVSVTTNFGFGGGLDLERIDADLARRDDVAGWTTLAFSNSVAVDGEVLPAVIIAGDHMADLTLDEGRLPSRVGEVALGAKTAASLGLSVGDRVPIGGREVVARTATVTGLVVLPSLGSFESDRPSPGDGIVLPGPMIARSYLESLIAFVGIDLTPGSDPDVARSSIRRSYEKWGVNEFQVDTSAPVRPAEIVDAESVRAIPLLVGGLLGLSLVVGLGAVVTTSVLARRRELAMLRTLGFTGRQLRTSVRVQAVVTMLAALVIGVPLGVAAGRVAWRAFAHSLAVVLPPSTPTLGVLALAAAALVAVLVVATVPAAVAGRAHPAVTLRTE